MIILDLMPSRDCDFNAALKRTPLIAANRKKLADVYRKARQENPVLARLLFRRIMAAERRAVSELKKVGLAALVND